MAANISCPWTGVLVSMPVLGENIRMPALKIPALAGLILGVLVLPLAASSYAAYGQSPPAGTPGKGVERLYQQICAACHGDQGNGQSRARFGLNPPPRDFTTPEAWDELSRERMLTSVKYGRPGTAMVGWGRRLSDQKIAALVDYVRSQFMHPPAADSSVLGKQLYKKHCSACHADRGNGASWARNSLNPPPKNFTSAASRAVLSRERMITSVTYGRPGTAMMPFSSRLSSQQIASVVDYIRSEFMRLGSTDGGKQGANTPPILAKQPLQPAHKVDMSLPLPNGLVGDYQRGRRFFLHNCFSCHGRQGNGKGPRADFIYPPPRNFLAVKSRSYLNRPALFNAISKGINGSVMPSWSKVLDQQQIADVAEFVFAAFIRGDGQAKHSTANDQAAATGGLPPQKKKALLK